VLSSFFVPVDEINLDPAFLFWRRLLVEITPRGVCKIKTLLGFGALQQITDIIKMKG
jgi:hypothetical protein